MECLIALTQGWTARVDPWWYPRLRGYRWQARVAGRGGRWRYAGRSLRTPRGQVCVAMARVILGYQDVDTGEVLRPGKVGFVEMPALDTQCIDVREQNLYAGSSQDILRHRRKQPGASSQYIGVSYHRRRQCWQAYVRVQGRLSRVGEFPTEQEAAQARDQRVLELGLSPLVRLNFPGAQERAPRVADGLDAARRERP
jgi:AP2 domain